MTCAKEVFLSFYLFFLIIFECSNIEEFNGQFSEMVSAVTKLSILIVEEFKCKDDHIHPLIFQKSPI